jgi:hypothetical protein
VIQARIWRIGSALKVTPRDTTNMHHQHNKDFTYPFSPRTICQSRNNACGQGCVFLSTWHPAHSTTVAATPVNHGNIETLIGAFVLVVVVVALKHKMKHKNETYKQHQKIQLGLERRPK